MDLILSRNYTKIFLNKSLKTAGLNGTERPDIIAIGKDGSVLIIEIRSPSQVSGMGASALEAKVEQILSNNPGITGQIIK